MLDESCFRLWLLVLAILLQPMLAVLDPIKPTVPNTTTILISFDGFRWDYLTKTDTPNFDYLVRTGVKAPFINPVFPTETIPNHYSMVTGLYPESHGILSGYYTYDPVWNSSFEMNTTDCRWWDGGEPVWVTNERQGHKSGVCFFPGYDVKIRDYLPSYTTKDMGFDKSFFHPINMMTYEAEVDLVLNWMQSHDPPSFIAMYFNQPDETSHDFGPNSAEVIEKIKRCDNITGYLIQRLKKYNLFDSTNLVLTSDHGHASYNTTFFLNFDPYIHQDNYTRKGTTTIQIWPKQDSSLEYVYECFKRMQNETHLITVFKTKDMPEKFHFKNSRRTPPIIAIMNEHWVANNTGFWQYWLQNNKTDSIHGEHSYSPELMSMKPFFVAKGPSFKEGYISSPFSTIDIYPLLCHVLNITPAPNNGSFDRVKELLKETKSSCHRKSFSDKLKDIFRDIWQTLGALV